MTLQGNDFNKKEVKKTLLHYVLSSVAAMWVFTIYTMVDGMFVARGVGPDALAAVNLSMPLINTSFGISILFAIGASTRASIYKGRGEFEKASHVFTMSTITVFVLSLIVTVICITNLSTVADILGATPETKGYVMEYLHIILFFDVCYMTAYNLEVLVKADGYPQKAIYTPLIGAVMNIGLDYVFIMHFHWGIKGAAWATGISQLVTLIIFTQHFLSSKSGFKFVKIKYSVKEALHTAKLGISDCVTELSMGLVIFMFNNALIRISGNDGVVVYTVISYVSQLILMTMVGLNQGMQPLVSFYYGRGEMHIKRYIFRLSVMAAIFFSLLAFVLGVTYPNPVVAMFIDPAKNPELFIHGVNAFRIFSFSFIPIGLVVVISGYFTAMEMAKSAMTISLCRGLIFVILALMIMSTLFGETGVWLTMTVSESLSLVVALVLYKRHKRTALQEMRETEEASCETKSKAGELLKN